MTRIFRTDLSYIFDQIADLLGIPDGYYDDAVRKYRAVGTWLGEGTSPLAVYSPVIYPQGSFLLGTVVKPLGDVDEYDIDLVFEMVLSKRSISQKYLKNLVGERLMAHELYNKMLDTEGRRCWTLIYADSAKFHLDILPAVPNYEYREYLKSLSVNKSWAETGIAITDKTRPNYTQIDPDWPSCNPKGYVSWFRFRMITQFEAQLKSMAEARKADIAKVPEYQVKTPLQKCIQLFKRHRDVFFAGKDDKPASILITTLAALAYNNEFDIVDALNNILKGMPTYITMRNGKPWVQNPVDPTENFADRWQDRPGREQDFRNWLIKLTEDINTVVNCYDIDRVCELLSQMFGEKISSTAVKSYKDFSEVHRRTTVTPISITKPNKPWGN